MSSQFLLDPAKREDGALTASLETEDQALRSTGNYSGKPGGQDGAIGGSPATAAFWQAASSRASKYLPTRFRTAYAERSQCGTRPSNGLAITSVVAGPVWSTRSRHHCGVRVWNTIFFGGQSETSVAQPLSLRT